MSFKSPAEIDSLDDAPAPADAPDPLAALARDAASGDHDARVRLLSLVAPPVTAAVRVLLGPRHPDLEDAVQEALVAITASLDRFRGESSFLHYARRIAVRTALALRRSRDERARRLAEVHAAQTAPDPWQREPLDLERARRLAAFRRLLDELPEGQAECLAYRVLLEHPLPQIARDVGVPVNTVRSRIRLARNHLRDRILADRTLAALLLPNDDEREPKG
jgi:RNA polymerase sigma-70 factor (ECF subfamily)